MSVHFINPSIQAYCEHMIGKMIVGAGVIDDEFCITLDDNSTVVLFSDEDLNMVVEFDDTSYN